jgi:hypothetical protein
LKHVSKSNLSDSLFGRSPQQKPRRSVWRQGHRGSFPDGDVFSAPLQKSNLIRASVGGAITQLSKVLCQNSMIAETTNNSRDHCKQNNNFT